MERDIERLEKALGELSRAISYPETPPIASEVERRLGEPPASQPAPAWALVTVAVAALVVLLAAFAGSVSPVRDAIADALDRINIFEGAEIPLDTTTEIEGERVTLAEAETLVGIDLLLPEGLEPEKVLYQDFDEVRAAALFFDNPEFVLFETDADVDKFLAPGADWARVEGFEGEAYWLTGLRLVQYRVEGGGTIQRSARVTDVNTLVWEQGKYVFRLEGNLSQVEAVEIARSLR